MADNTPSDDADESPRKRRPRTFNAATKSLADQLRRDVAGMPTDNRLEQSAHYRGVIFVAIRAVMDAVGGCTVRVTKRRKKKPKGEKLGDRFRGIVAKSHKATRRGIRKAMPTPNAHQSDEKWVPLDDPEHSLVGLLDRPNPTETIQDLLAYLVLQYLLTGSALLWVNRDQLGLPAELYGLPTALCYAQPATTDYPLGWWRVTQYYPSGGFGILPTPVAGGGQPVDGRDVHRFKAHHPLWRWDAFSPLTAAKHQLDVLEAIDQARWTAMDAGVTPSMVISIPGLSEPQCDRIAEKVAERNAGRRNHRKALVLSGEQGSEDKPDVSFPDTSPKDMDFASGWEQMVGFALAVFGVPKSVAGLTGTSSYSELYAALKQFHTLTLGPLVARLARWLTRKLAHVWGRDYAIEIDLPRIDDADLQERQVSTDAQNSAITVNEIRALRNRPPVEDGDLPPKVYEAKLTAKMQAEQQQEAAPPQGALPPGMPGMPGMDPSQGGAPPAAPGQADPLAAMAQQAQAQAPPTDPAAAVLSAFGLVEKARLLKALGMVEKSHWRLHGKFVSRAKLLAAIARGEVTPDGKTMAELKGGADPGQQPAPQQPQPQQPAPPEGGGEDPRVEAYRKLRAAGKPVPECVGRVFGPALAEAGANLQGDPGEMAQATAKAHAADLAKLLKVSEGEAHAAILAAFEELAKGGSGGAEMPQPGGATPQPAATSDPSASQDASADEGQPAEEPEGEPGPPSIPRPANPAGKGSLPPRMAKAMISMEEVRGAAREKPHRFGCVYVPLPEVAADRLRELADMIPDADLADDGREDDPHVTLLFGLHPEVTGEAVKSALAGAGPVRFRLGAVSVFRGADSGRDYDVVKVDVLGADCPRLHGTLGALPHTRTHPTYVPHATIAYVRAGLGEEYARWFGRLDLDCEATRAVYSDASKKKTRVPLAAGLARVDKAMSALSDVAGGALVPPAGSGRAIPVKRAGWRFGGKKRKRSVGSVCKALLAEIAEGSAVGADDGMPMSVDAAVDELLSELGV